MDYKRSNAPLNTVTRDVIALSQDTGNVYETVCIIAKRANQIAVEMKKILKETPRICHAQRQPRRDIRKQRANRNISLLRKVAEADTDRNARIYRRQNHVSQSGKRKSQTRLLTTDSKAHNKRRICPMAVRRFFMF